MVASPLVTFMVRAGLFPSHRAQVAFALFVGALFTSAQFWNYGRASSWVYAAMLAGVILVNVNRFVPGYVRIGDDGFFFAAVWKRRFVRYADVTAIETSNWGVVLTLRTGKTILIRTNPDWAPVSKDAKRDSLAAALGERLEIYRQRATTSNAVSLLARGGRTVDAWMKSLAAVNPKRAGSYRTAALPQDELWRVVEDATADPSARAGATVVLREALDDAGRTRLRVAIDGIAAPKVRVAMRAAADGESHEAMAQALAAAEGDLEDLEVGGDAKTKA